jgi:hypothetical protein
LNGAFTEALSEKVLRLITSSVTSIADYWHNHLLISLVISKNALEAITQVEEIILSRNLAFKHLWLDNIIANIDR